MKPQRRWRYREVVLLLRLPATVSLVQTIATDPTVVPVLAPVPTAMTVKIVAAEALPEAEREARSRADEVIKGRIGYLK